MKAESRLKLHIYKRLKELRIRYRKLWWTKIQQASKRGTPDMFLSAPCLLCERGLHVAIELKDGENYDPDALQLLELKRIGESGALGIVVRKTADLVVLEEYLTHPPEVISEDAFERLVKYTEYQKKKRGL